MARRLVIAIDCDDVLVPTTPYFIEAYNKQHGTAITLENSHNGSDEVWGAARPLQVERLDALTKTEEYRALGPSRQEIEILRSLSESHSLHLITARKPEEYNLTKAMLDRDLPAVFTSLDFVGWEGSKGQACHRIGADVLIDDSARHLRDAMTYGLSSDSAILFGDYPWSGHDDATDAFVHCVDWASVKQAVDELAQRG